jgi:predicted RecA/RadA family phage recombinase
MPTINFPSGPSLNDSYNLGTRTWKWNGEAWALQPLTGGFTGSAGASGYTGSAGAGGSSGAIGYTGSTGASAVDGTTERFTYTISGTPTTVSGNDNSGNTLAYDSGLIDVFLNGIKMVNGTDVTVTSGTSVVFASSLTSGDVVDITTFGVFNITGMNASNLSSGTVPEARLPTTTFMTNVLNDLSTIALRSATTENAIAYNTNSSFVDVFQDSSGIASHTTSARSSDEYVNTIGSSAFTTDTAGTLETGLNNLHNFDNNSTDAHGSMVLTNSDVAPTYDSSIKKFGTHSVVSTADNQGFSLDWNSNGYANFVTNESLSMSCWFYQTADNGQWNMIYDGYNSNNYHHVIFAGRYSGQDDSGIMDFGSGWNNGGGTIVLNQWHHYVFMISTTQKQIYMDGVRVMNSTGNYSFYSAGADARLFKRYSNSSNLSVNAHIDQLAFWKNKILSTTEIADLYNSGNAFSQSINATGNFISNAITAPSSTSKMGAIITYQDQAGTNALNSDIVLQLSADNGSNFTTATLTALPNFSTGIKMAKVNDLSVTAGTQLKYKISFANQSGSKEARIKGVSLQY